MSNGRSNVGVAGTALMSKLSLLSDETRREIDHWVAKFPPGRQRSAVHRGAARRAGAEPGIPDAGSAWTRWPSYLKLPPIQVYEVATFYSMFETHPCGRHHVSICTNISCMLNGAEALVAHVEKKLGIKLEREHGRRTHLPQARGGVPRRLQRRAR